MTPEQKDLLLKDLCARLPYGVNVEYTFKVTVIATNVEEIMTRPLFLCSINTLDNMTVSGIDDDGDETICFFDEVKPYLFPMSSMTEEQRVEAFALLNNCDYYTIDNTIKWLDNHPIKFFDWCNKNHFDYRGLIEQGLAIDATGKNIY